MFHHSRRTSFGTISQRKVVAHSLAFFFSLLYFPLLVVSDYSTTAKVVSVHAPRLSSTTIILLLRDLPGPSVDAISLVSLLSYF